jgi:MFS family permease
MTTPVECTTKRLRPLRAAMFLQGIAPWVPVEKLFMNGIGFTPALVAAMAAAYAAVVPLMEIPSGILADRWSRRGVLMLAAGAALLSVIVGGLSQNVGTVVGGLIAALVSPRATYFITIPCSLLAVLVLTRLREPKLHQSHEPFTKHIATTFRAMALGSMTLQMMFEFGPLWLIAAGASTVLFGPHTAGMTAAFGIGGSLAGRLKLFRPSRSLALTGAMVACSLVLVASTDILVLIAAQVAIAALLVVSGI